MKNKFLSTILEESLNYLSILSTEKEITKLSYEEAIKEQATKNCRRKVLQSCLEQLINKNIMLSVWIL
jgi:Mor family transcriptional regulator